MGLLKMLLEKGVSVNAKDKVKRTDNLFLSRVGFHLTPTEYLREDGNCSTSYTHSYDENIIVNKTSKKEKNVEEHRKKRNSLNSMLITGVYGNPRKSR